MKLKPLGKRLVLKAIESENVTDSGIAISTSTKEKQDYAEIVELSDKLIDEGKFNIGDKVIYSQYAGTTINDGDIEYIIVKKDDVLAIVLDEEEK